jgi:hypothetical protein
MQKKIYAFSILALLLSTTAQAEDSTFVQSSPMPWEVNLTLRSSIYLPTPRPIGDVFFVLNNSTPDLVYRVERKQAEDPMNLAKMAYAATNATPHDTYKLTPNALGPFPKGAAMGFTLEQWLAAKGLGTYIEEDGNATINVTLHNLVPKGTYSFWCQRVTMPPSYRDDYLPLGKPDGSENVISADETGNATFNLRMKALPESTNLAYPDYVAMYVTEIAPMKSNLTWTLISAVYHSDGRTHGANPGEFGKNAHTQLTYLMYPKPARDYQEWKNMTSLSPPSQ